MDEALLDVVLARLDRVPLAEGAASLLLAACEGDAALAAELSGEQRDGPERDAARADAEPTGAYLRSITVSGFRGVGPAETLDLEPGPGLTVIVGRNGSGKSSFADGLEVPAGPRAVLVTRAVAEASRLGAAAGAEARTFAGLAGLGNLLVRASGDRSDDYLLGRHLADGSVTGNQARTEGARACVAAVELAGKLRVRVPVLSGLALVLAGKAEPREAARIIGETVAEEE